MPWLNQHLRFHFEDLFLCSICQLSGDHLVIVGNSSFCKNHCLALEPEFDFSWITSRLCPHSISFRDSMVLNKCPVVQRPLVQKMR